MMKMMMKNMPAPLDGPGRLAASGGRSRLLTSDYVGTLKLAKYFQNFVAVAGRALIRLQSAQEGIEAGGEALVAVG